MRTDKELVTELLRVFENSEIVIDKIDNFTFQSNELEIYHTYYGLCCLVSYMAMRQMLRFAEEDRLHQILDDNKPGGVVSHDYWFTKVNHNPEKAKQERLDFLNKILCSYTSK